LAYVVKAKENVMLFRGLTIQLSSEPISIIFLKKYEIGAKR
jgi:hypothetical protein